MVRCRRQTGQRRSSRGSQPREPPCRSQSQPSFPPSPAPVLSVLESASAQSNRPPENARADAATIFQENATFNPIAPPAASTPPTAVRALCHQFNPASNSQSPAPFPGDPPLDWKPPELLAARAWAICIPDARGEAAKYASGRGGFVRRLTCEASPTVWLRGPRTLEHDHSVRPRRIAPTLSNAELRCRTCRNLHMLRRRLQRDLQRDFGGIANVLESVGQK